MINKKYLDRAYTIRKDYLKINSDLSDILEDVQKIKENIEKAITKLEGINSSSSNYTSKEDFQGDILNELMEFEEESNRLKDIMNPLNDSMEKLKIDEQDLYNEIAETYTNLKTEDIVKYVQDYIREKGLGN